VEVVELPGADECCGFGGSFSVRLPEVSAAILDKKLRNVEATGARAVVACDAGCLMQMGGGLTRRGSPIRALHLAQVLAGEDGA
jgi:L-lactate dehydrogenase complex protein LldE